jgi:arylsulfatase A-like enzyme
MSQPASRRRFLKSLALGAAGAVLPRALRAAEPPARRPNVVFFLIDDMGWTDAACYGSSFYETPGIDRLAAEGMRFTDAYAACPVCSPTRASIMSGKYPARLHLTNWFYGNIKKKLVGPPYIHQLPLEETTLAEAFDAAGYATCFIGKWHLGREPYFPEKQGFDINIAGNASGSPRGGYFSPYRNPQLPNGPKGEYLTDRLTDEAVSFLDARHGEPFFLYLSHYAVHTPIQAKKPLIEEYAAKAKALQPPDGPRFLPEGSTVARQVQDHPVYGGMVDSMDQSVGRVMRKLDELGAAKNTIVVFMSDNGGLSTRRGAPTSNAPLRAGKGWLYEGGIREPMIIKWPGVTTPGSTCSVPVTSTDFYPTLLEAAGLPLRPEQHADGVSLVPLLKGGTSLDREALYWHYPHYSPQGGTPSGAVRAGDWKLIEFFEDMHVELYNLREDIGEQHDLAEKKPEKAEELRARLHQWRESLDARMPRPNTRRKPEPEPGPLKEGDKDDEFDVLRGAAVDPSDLGYALRSTGTGAPGLALNKLKEPVKGKATFRVQLQSLKPGQSRAIYKNGFLVFGAGPNDLVECGCYLGGRRFFSVAHGGNRQEVPLPGDPMRRFELRVNYDPASRTVTMACEGKTVTLTLRRPLGPITHVGYANTNTVTAFSAVEVIRPQ